LPDGKSEIFLREGMDKRLARRGFDLPGGLFCRHCEERSDEAIHSAAC
jgi:hypothetical protein